MLAAIANPIRRTAAAAAIATPARAALAQPRASTSAAINAAADDQRRTFAATASAAYSEPFDRPGPVPLPPKEQREFEKLVREKANSLQFNKPAASASGDKADEPLHPDVRRKPKPDFEGLRRSRIPALLLKPTPNAFGQVRAFATSRPAQNDKPDPTRSQDDKKNRPPSKASDPFPLPFDPALTSSSIEGTPPPPDLASASQLDGLPTFTFAQEPDFVSNDAADADGEGATGSREVYSPMTRVPGRTPLTEGRERTIARLVYQVRKRGTLETDLLLSTFAKTELKKLSDDELLEFDRLLDEPDWDIFYWATERKPVPERWATSFSTPGKLGWRLRKHTKNEEKVPRRMPDLD